MKRLMFAALASAVCFSSQAQDDPTAQTSLATAKMAGACEILDQLVQFQTSTGIDGGDLFVARFWESEAARLGLLDTQELSDLCDKSILTYQKLFEAAGAPQTSTKD